MEEGTDGKRRQWLKWFWEDVVLAFWGHPLVKAILLGIFTEFFFWLFDRAGWYKDIPWSIVVTVMGLWLEQALADTIRWRKFREETIGYWDKFREETIKSAYPAFVSLLGNNTLQKRMEDLLDRISSIQQAKRGYRATLLNFTVEAISSLADGGIARLNVSVTDYVQYIKQILKEAETACATCQVRPYWFVADGIDRGVVSAKPYEEDKEKSGKGEHLPFFKAHQDAQRILVVHEEMLAEMLLTAYIDKTLYSLAERCPVCLNLGKGKCPVHNGRIENRSPDDLPELDWFKKYVHPQGVEKLIFTRLCSTGLRDVDELRDRMFIHCPAKDGAPEFKLNLEFVFQDSETGVMRISWGDRAISLRPIHKFYPDKEPKQDSNWKGEHLFYRSMANLLDWSNKIDHELMRTHLQKLKSLLQTDLRGYGFDNSPIPMQHPGEKGYVEESFRKAITEVIEKLYNELGGTSKVAEIYAALVGHYRTAGAPACAYLVTYDPIHPDYPLRYARWQDNWRGIEAKK